MNIKPPRMSSNYNKIWFSGKMTNTTPHLSIQYTSWFRLSTHVLPITHIIKYFTRQFLNRKHILLHFLKIVNYIRNSSCFTHQFSSLAFFHKNNTKYHSPAHNWKKGVKSTLVHGAIHIPCGALEYWAMTSEARYGRPPRHRAQWQQKVPGALNLKMVVQLD